jgi:hypothetical protein
MTSTSTLFAASIRSNVLLAVFSGNRGGNESTVKYLGIEVDEALVLAE